MYSNANSGGTPHKVCRLTIYCLIRRQYNIYSTRGTRILRDLRRFRYSREQKSSFQRVRVCPGSNARVMRAPHTRNNRFEYYTNADADGTAVGQRRKDTGRVSNVNEDRLYRPDDPSLRRLRFYFPIPVDIVRRPRRNNHV